MFFENCTIFNKYCTILYNIIVQYHTIIVYNIVQY